ncbi:MAG: 5-formyltetrahydrofolate cyclo-ligase, partial [Gammaproteobacteria bacterium]|nr:5-formyltetrahydrofolate cyclo-ligase [Gammaproteobacteria bacterium]
RAALAPARRAAAAQAIAARCRTHPVVARARSVFVFVSTPEEVATHDLIDWFVATGRQVLVPLLAGRDLMHAVPFPGWAAMAPAALGILSPPADSLPWPSPVDLVLAPGLAFTPYGARLGYGAGYYDAWIARNAPGALLALAFDCQVVDRLPESPHDRRVDGIITESRDIDCGACRDET